MKHLLLKLRSDTRGTTAIEYALIACVLSIGIIGALYQIAPLMESNYGTVNSAFEQAN